MKPFPKLTDDNRCFACGLQNPNGLRLVWTEEENSARARFRPHPHHQGWAGLLHGGILAVLLDEAMTRLAWRKFGGAVTAELSVRYLEPVSISEELVVCGRIVNQNRKLVLLEGEVRRTRDEKIVARGKATAMRIQPS